MTNNWIQDANVQPGKLHRALHIPMSEKIPIMEERGILKTPAGEKYHGITVTPQLHREANFALNVRRYKP